jgi:hypothetical protein
MFTINKHPARVSVPVAFALAGVSKKQLAAPLQSGRVLSN